MSFSGHPNSCDSLDKKKQSFSNYVLNKSKCSVWEGGKKNAVNGIKITQLTRCNKSNEKAHGGQAPAL